MSNEMKRMNYFNGLLLKEEDLELDQNYHIKLQRLHNRFFHEWGIVDGLTVKEVSGFPKVTVNQGLAINRTKDEKTNQMISQEIWVCENHPESTVDLSQCDALKNIFIIVRYHEEPADIVNVKGGDMEIHIWERAQIDYSTKMPDDPSKDIVIACVVLKIDEYQNKIVASIQDYIEEDQFDKSGKLLETKKKTQVCNYAVTQGTAREFQKVIIGEKDKLNLPYIDGFADSLLGPTDGLEFHSPYTKFSGKLLSGDLKTSGDLEVNGAFTVKANTKDVFTVDSKGDVAIEKTALVKGTLSATGGLNVKGDNTTLDTKKVTLTGNMLLINEDEQKDRPSGIEVSRGTGLLNAKFVWDESEEVWKAGTDQITIEGGGVKGGLFSIAYGTAWNQMHDGKSFADEYHKHSELCNSDGIAALSINTNGNVTVSGSIIPTKGIEVPINDETNAKLQWNGEHWQAGTTNKMFDLPYGADWDALTSGINADGLHTHSEFSSSDGYVAMSVSPNGDVIVGSNLAVAKDLTVEEGLTAKKDLTVEGNLIVNGTISQQLASGDELHTHSKLCDKDDIPILNVNTDGNISIEKGAEVKGSLTVNGNFNVIGQTTFTNKVEMQVDDNVILLNKYVGDTSLVNESGIEIYRGSEEKARLVWNEELKKWEIGIGNQLEEIASGNKWDSLIKQLNADSLHTHSQLYNQKGDVLALSIRAAGSVDVTHDLNVGKDINILGILNVKGALTRIESSNIEIVSNLITMNRFDIDMKNASDEEKEKVYNAQTGLTVFRGNIDNAQDAIMVWDESNDYWKIGLIDSLKVFKVKNDGSIETTAADIQGNLNAASANIQGSLVVQKGIEVNRDPETRASIKWDEESLQPQWKIGTDSVDSDVGISVTADGKVGIANVDPQEKLDVIGNANISGKMKIGEGITVAGSSVVTGKLTAGSAEFQGSIKVTGAATESGLEIERVDNNGYKIPSAKLSWNETSKCWMFGTEAQMVELKLNGETEVGDHNHNQLWSKSLKAISVSTDDIGQVGIGTNSPNAKLHVNGDAIINEKLSVTGDAIISQKLSVTGDASFAGKVTAKSSFNISRGTNEAAKLYWNESGKVWQAGTGSELKNISLSDHSHTELTSFTGILTVNGGNIDIGKADDTSNLTLRGNTTIQGYFTASGNIDAINGKLSVREVGISGSLSAANAYISGTLAVSKGIEISGTTAEQKAQITWDSTNKKWQAGIVGALKNLSYENHTHTEFSSITSLMTVNEGNIDIGKADNTSNLTLRGNTTIQGYLTASGNVDAINGKLSVRDVGISGSLSAVNVDITGNLSATDVDLSGDLSAVNVDISGTLAVSNGLEISGTTAEQKAQITWDSINKKWQAGIVGALKNLSYENHTHTEFSSITSLMTVNEGNIDIGKADNTSNLTLRGNTTIQGYLTASGNIDAINGKLNVKDVGISGSLSAVNVDITGNLSATDVDLSGDLSAANVNISGTVGVSKGIEISGTTAEQKAQIVWDSTNQKWQAGTSDALKDIEFSDHYHQKLYASKDVEAVIVDTEGNVGIGKTPETGIKLLVNGDISATNITAMLALISTMQNRITTLEGQVTGLVTAHPTT